MNTFRSICLLFIILPIFTACQSVGEMDAEIVDPTKMDREVETALANLYETTPAAKYLAARAKGILVFPDVLKAGFIGAAEYGNGALRKNNRTDGYYNIVAGSYGFQAGVESFAYALFFMNEDALSYLDNSDGFEVGVGPNVVVMNKGMARNFTTMTLRDDVYAFVFGQEGLMAGMGLQGSKITKVAN